MSSRNKASLKQMAAAIRADFAEKDYTDRRATFVGHCPLPAAGCLGVQPEAACGPLCALANNHKYRRWRFAPR